RPEQKAAVEKTKRYFLSCKEEASAGSASDKAPQFLWNAKMRFGKTFTSYQLAKSMDWKKVLVLTFKPAVQNSWKEELMNHVDFKGWQFISKDTENLQAVVERSRNHDRPLVCFGSFQDYLGKNTKTGGIKTKNEWVHLINWDCVIFDEYHFGA